VVVELKKKLMKRGLLCRGRPGDTAPRACAHGAKNSDILAFLPLRGEGLVGKS